MKKWIFLSVLSLFLVACSSENSPKTVASKFIEAVNKGELDEAKKYSDDTTASMLTMMGSLYGDEIKKNAKGEGFKITKVEENGDTAKVHYTYGKEGKEDTVDLKKIDGNWKVSMDKEGASSKSEEAPATK